VLERHGWMRQRIKSSHLIYSRPDRTDIVSVPVHGNKTLKPGTQRTLMKTADLLTQIFNLSRRVASRSHQASGNAIHPVPQVGQSLRPILIAAVASFSVGEDTGVHVADDAPICAAARGAASSRRP